MPPAFLTRTPFWRVQSSSPTKHKSSIAEPQGSATEDGGAGIKKVKPLLDECLRWRTVLHEPYERHKIRYRTSDLLDSKSFNPTYG